MFIRMRNLLSGLIIGLALASCGGGGGGQVAEGGIGGTGISTGSVTGFGSIWVNGVEFSTAGARVIEEDDLAGAVILNTDESDDPTELAPYLSEGMVVTVTGTINDDGLTGTAETISYEDILEGPIVGTPSGNTLNVLGQTVNVVIGETKYACDESYVICPLTGFSDLKDRQVVEISGYIDGSGVITAGYIELQEDDYTDGLDEFEIKGTASVVDAVTFNIGGLSIITTNTVGLNGEFVEAKGTFLSASTRLTASEVELEDESFDDDNAAYEGYKIELEGLIVGSGCSGAITCSFTLRGVTVFVDSNTVYSGSAGSYSSSDLIDGSKIEAEGVLQGGVLLANEIEFK